MDNRHPVGLAAAVASIMRNVLFPVTFAQGVGVLGGVATGMVEVAVGGFVVGGVIGYAVGRMLYPEAR